MESSDPRETHDAPVTGTRPMYRARIDIPDDLIADFCRRHRIRWLALFGSVLRDDFTDESDIDVLVEFEPDAAIGWEIFDIERELSALLGRRVDLNMIVAQGREQVGEFLHDAEVRYAVA